MKKINKKIFQGMLLLMTVISLAFLVSAASFSNPQFISPSITTNYLKTQGINFYPVFNENMCSAGQDFIVQVSPLGCSPSVVRSDLLEEQNVPVFCQLQATNINPLIDVKAISQISFKGQYPKEISGVGFYPARAAVKGFGNTLLNSPILANIGYAVIVLKQQPNESQMPDFVRGNLTATLKYDIENAFGIGQAVYYLPELSSDEWSQRFKQYGFWNGKGFLRAESVDVDSAVVSVYLDENTKFSTLNLKKGQISDKIYLPGFFCLAGLQLRLESTDAQDTRAKINVNNNIIEVANGEKFLDNACTVRDLRKDGLNQNVKISCRTDDGVDNFEFRITPKIRLEINGEQKDYNIGDFLYETEDRTKSVYLAYAGTGIEGTGGTVSETNSNNEGELFAFLVEVPLKKEKMSDVEVSTIAGLVKRITYQKITSVGIADFLTNSAKFASSGTESLLRYLGQGLKSEFIFYNKQETVGGKGVKILGLGTPNDDKSFLESNPSLKTNYENAIADYKTIISQYPGEKEDALNSQETFGEQALINAIKLANEASQRKTMVDLCKEFDERYPESKTIIPDCTNPFGASNPGVSAKSILLNGNIKQISFEGVFEPTIDEYGVEILVRDPQQKTTLFVMRKNDVVKLNDKGDETLQLISITNQSAIVNVILNPESTTQQIVQATISSERKKLDLNVANSFGSRYQFTLTKVNLKNQAKVSVIPGIDNAKTEANVTFSIGIEKRGIQLSPSEIKDRIDSLNESIDKWEGISGDLGKAVEGFNAACLTTGAYLTVKNFFSNTDGRSIARQEVMRSQNGWTDRCKQKVSNGEYSSLDKCFIENAAKIDKDVETVYNAIQKQQPITDENLCNELSQIAPSVDDKISNGLTEKNLKTFTVTNDLNRAFFSDEETGRCEKITLTQAKDLERLNLILNDPSSSAELKALAESRRYSILSDIDSNVKNYAEYSKFNENLKKQSWISGPVGVDFQSSDKDAVVGNYFGAKTDSSKGTIPGKIPSGSSIQPVQFNNEKYFLTLNDNGRNQYSIDKVYDENGEEANQVTTDKIKARYRGFKKFDPLTYQNKFVNPEVKYFETEPYKGFPALVPFDTVNGWYVATKQPLLAVGSSNLRAYDESGRLTSFWLCNVGENGKAEFESGFGDDICQQFNPGTGQIAGTFQGLDQTETNKRVGQAINAVTEAQRQYRTGISGNVRILGNNIKVGKPSIGIPEFQCQDFMSPDDCKLLFNACDPVVCPSSRCNLGGTFNVADVAQSGIVGSTVLCSPNFVGFGGDVVVPVCLTGVKAGVDGLVSVQKNYRDCLQANLETGSTIGICDEIHSIYLCDFFWSQAAPLAEVALPKIFELVSSGGQPKSRGGGEYLGVQAAWQNARNSVDYITQYYGANSFNAFKALATEGIGKAVCHNFVSATYPSDVGLSSLIKPRSPPQFHAWFSEQTFTTATIPATSQYKVFYHIYAGENNVQNIGAYYTVYLKSPVGTSFYQTNPTVTVASGYIAKGDYASETRDFTAPSGYKELCIRVNAQEECGFKQVTTDFTLNYLNDQYLKEQAGQTNINSEIECISGTSSLYSFINPNVQAGATDFANPQLYEKGIVRICATDNPGKGTDPAAGTTSGRWLEVGTCDNGAGKVKCYLDRQSVTNVIQSTDIENQTLQQASQKANELLKQGNYIQDFNTELEKIDKMSFTQKITYINKGLLDRALLNGQKAKLLIIRADAYAGLARAYILEVRANLLSPFFQEGIGDLETSVPGEIREKGIIERAVDAVKNFFTPTPSETTTLTGPPLPSPQNQVQETLSDNYVIERLSSYDNIINDRDLYLLVPSYYNSLIKAIILQESKARGINDCDNNIESAGCFSDGSGSYGLMQVSFAAATDVQNKYFRDATVGRQRMDLTSFESFKNEMTDSKKNIYTGTLYYKILEDYYKLRGNEGDNLKKITLAAYNWGRGNIQDNCKNELWLNCQEIPSSVLQYVSNILEYEKSFN